MGTSDHQDSYSPKFPYSTPPAYLLRGPRHTSESLGSQQSPSSPLVTIVRPLQHKQVPSLGRVHHQRRYCQALATRASPPILCNVPPASKLLLSGHCKTDESQGLLKNPPAGSQLLQGACNITMSQGSPQRSPAHSYCQAHAMLASPRPYQSTSIVTTVKALQCLQSQGISEGSMSSYNKCRAPAILTAPGVFHSE